ncbi:MAG: tripartite tricarboxylate transporter substrate binding protein [Rhizobiales bacterium]|nr:tripartite tricarboxylate transporter substrate binding protein [Hyphomicrobiales bacterium]
MKMTMVGGALLAAALAFSPLVHAQNYPSKPIKIVVPYSAGGGTDIVARMIAGKLTEKMRQRAYVENRAGAGGNLGAAEVYEAAPDGYTLLFTAQGPLAVNKHMYEKLTYDPERFTPVSLAVVAYSVLLAGPKVEAKDLKGLIAQAKANPGKINYASQGIGTAAHLTAELFKSMGGINLVHVPYKGSAPALTDLVGGHIDLMFGELAPSGPYISSGKLRPFAVGSEKRNPTMPNVPAVSEVLPGFAVTSWWAIVAPPNMPDALTSKLSKGIAEALRDPTVSKRLGEMGMEVKASSPAELGAFAKKDSALWGKVIREANIKVK